MGKKKRKDLTEENLTNTDVTNTDVGFGEMAIQQERIGAKLDHLIEWFEREQEARDRPFVRLKREWEDREALERQRLRREEQERLEEKAAVIIQAFLRTTVVRVKLDRAEQLWGRKNVRSWVRYIPFTLGPWWKDYRARMEAKERAAVRERACGHLNGKLMNLESDGSTMEREGDRFWFECHGDAVSAVVNGDQMTWDDGCIWKTEAPCLS